MTQRRTAPTERTDSDAEARPAAGEHRMARRAALGLIGLYQGLMGTRPSPCRYFPTCSNYAAEAIERHGLWYGGRLALCRLGRCRPGGDHGVDLVPLERPTRRSAAPRAGAPCAYPHEVPS